jgi:TRAP-type C4-dicarboxylate transport system permease small subunit
VTEQIDLSRAERQRSTTPLGLLDAAAETVALVAFLAVILATLLQVLTRYVLHVPLPWTEELARTLFVASMMIGIALATRRGEHIVVDFLFLKLPPRGKAAALVAFDAAILLLLAVWLRGAIVLIGINAGATFVTLPWLRVAYLYAVEAGAIVLMMVFVFADAVRRTRELGMR